VGVVAAMKIKGWTINFYRELPLRGDKSLIGFSKNYMDGGIIDVKVFGWLYCVSWGRL
jgi:hypothetical protein